MCGIIGVLGKQDVADHLVGALKRLEYRGYDSAGIATLSDQGIIERRRAAGKLSNLETVLKESPVSGRSGIGHTRWATHGAPSSENAHPHATEAVAVVHNGIIENYQDIKASLDPDKHSYKSETDSEVIVHLVTQLLEEGLPPKEAAFEALDRLKGAYAVALLFRGEEDLLIGARQGPPLAFGLGEDEMYLASDSYALAPLTKKICFLEDGDRVVLSRTSYQIYDVQGTEVERSIRITAQSGAAMGKGAYKHFMLKEIYEQPAVIGDTLNSFINPATNDIHFPNEIIKALKDAPRLTLIGCGGSFYASLLAKYWFEQIAGIPCEVDIASEYRYRTPPLPKGGVCIFTSQSGETVDTLEALRYCKSQGQTIISIVNTIESTIERESDHVLKTLAGPEIAVASTKATTTQYTTFACLALAAAKGRVEDNEYDAMAEALRHLPATTRAVLAYDDAIKTISRDIAEARDVLYLGRGSFYPIALEGALKLKEICYIHAEGYAAGEMKHGPIALIDDAVPVICLAPHNDPLFEKNLSNIQETIARGGQVFLISDQAGTGKLKDQARWSVTLDDIHPFVAPILYTIPVQLLAYHTAVVKGTDVDQPRNLAKSVTVE